VNYIIGMLEGRENTGDYRRFEKEIPGKSFQGTLPARRIRLKVRLLEQQKLELIGGKQNIDRERAGLYGDECYREGTRLL
jgi:hypothetical protein